MNGKSECHTEEEKNASAQCLDCQCVQVAQNSANCNGGNTRENYSTLKLVSDFNAAESQLRYLEYCLYNQPAVADEFNADTMAISVSTSISDLDFCSNSKSDPQEQIKSKITESTQTDFLPEVHECNHVACPHKTTADELQNSNKLQTTKSNNKRSLNVTAKELRSKLENLQQHVNNLQACSSRRDQIGKNSNTVCTKDDWRHNLNCKEAADNDEFPLIHSPLLNTPPYETIVLTQQNESKYRIFFNQKLCRTFQQESKSFNSKARALSTTNNNHYLHDAKDLNVNREDVLISCFDPSDVDCELKEIFTQKPPQTHKIVRRRPRKERGSSVPAIDSFYGTQDMEKVGHASYFIPTLTASERQSIGWRHEYHYGKWKYEVPIAPKSTTAVSLHPKKTDVNCGGFYSIAEFGSLSSTSCAQPFQQGEMPLNDCLSFITLSDSRRDSFTANCHRLIPERKTIRRLIRWMVPCLFKDRVRSAASELPYHTSCNPRDFSNCTGAICTTDKEKGGGKHHKHRHHHHFGLFGSHKSNTSVASSVVRGGDVPLSCVQSGNFNREQSNEIFAMDTSTEELFQLQCGLSQSDYNNFSSRAPVQLTVYTVDQLDLNSSSRQNVICVNTVDLLQKSVMEPTGVVEEKSDLKKEFSRFSLNDNNGTIKNEKSTVVAGVNFPYDDDIPTESPFSSVQEMVVPVSDSEDENENKLNQLPRRKFSRSDGRHRLCTLAAEAELLRVQKANAEKEISLLNNKTKEELLDPDFEAESSVVQLSLALDPEGQPNNSYLDGITQHVVDVSSDLVYYKDFYSSGREEPTVDQETRFLDPKDLQQVGGAKNDRFSDSSSSFWSLSDDYSSLGSNTVSVASHGYSALSDNSLGSGKGPTVTIACADESTNITVADEELVVPNLENDLKNSRVDQMNNSTMESVTDYLKTSLNGNAKNSNLATGKSVQDYK